MATNKQLVKIIQCLSCGVVLVISACNTSQKMVGVNSSQTSSANEVTATFTPPSSSTAVPTETRSPTETVEPTQTATPLHTAKQTPIAPTMTATETALPTITPTYAILRGTVLEQANCRYGPGSAYLYKYGVYSGYYMDIIGRNETGTWVVVQAIGGTNPCWVKASLINIKGDVMSLAPMWLPLPESPYYGPLTGAWADRDGTAVIISWDPLYLKAGDDSLQYPYLVEAWLCQGGKLNFTPIGSWETMITVQDEPGCSEASHARVYGVEKHGYTAWVNIPWPLYKGTATATP